MNLKEKIILFFATGGGLGRLPRIPGTFGTLAGIPFAICIAFVDKSNAVFLTVLLIVFATWISDEAEVILGEKDPGCIVIDEIAGYVVAMAGIHISLYSLASGFLIFRFFDILKPPPVKNFEKKFKGGAGVVLDDIIAGLLSYIVLRIIF